MSLTATASARARKPSKPSSSRKLVRRRPLEGIRSNWAVTMRIRRTTAIRPMKRNGSTAIVCAQHEAERVGEFSNDQEEQDPIEHRDAGVDRARAGRDRMSKLMHGADEDEYRGSCEEDRDRHIQEHLEADQTAEQAAVE
jgi:hypothetical protein